MASGCICLRVGEHWLLDLSLDDDVHEGDEHGVMVVIKVVNDGAI